MLDHLTTTTAQRARLHVNLEAALGANDRPTNGLEANAAALAEAIAWDGDRLPPFAELQELTARLEALRDEQLDPDTRAAYDFDALAERVGSPDIARIILGFVGAFPNAQNGRWHEGRTSELVDVPSLA